MAWLDALNAFLWGLAADWITLVGLFLTLGLQFLPLRELPWTCRQLWQSFRDQRAGPGEISSFAALMTALGGTLGVGHLTGMAISLGVGGPGVVPRMWLVGVVGMAFGRRSGRSESPYGGGSPSWAPPPPPAPAAGGGSSRKDDDWT